jgi:DNA-binding NtrC family response regulator
LFTVPRKKNILLVDDDIAVREALVNALQTENYHVLQVADGEAAIQLLLDNPIDIALLDLGLENECGWDVFQQVRKLGLGQRAAHFHGQHMTGHAGDFGAHGEKPRKGSSPRCGRNIEPGAAYGNETLVP